LPSTAGLGPLVPGATDIEQLVRLGATLGSVDEASWPEVAALPDWGKLLLPTHAGVPLGQLLPDAPPAALELLAAALGHPYFTAEPAPATLAELAAFAAAALARHEAAEANLKRLAALLPGEPM